LLTVSDDEGGLPRSGETPPGGRDVGGFEGWVRSRLGWDDRLARRILSVHENLADKAGEFTRLSREALFQLAAPSETAEVREKSPGPLGCARAIAGRSQANHKSEATGSQPRRKRIAS
jgi:hypothetical protein